MKRTTILLCVLLSVVVSWGQRLSSISKSYGSGYSVQVIQPTVENFIKLCDMTDAQFEAEMKSHKYFKIDETANPIGYWNGSIDNFAYAFAVNSFYRNILSEETQYLAKKEYIYPASSVTDFIRSLKPYYYARKPLFYDTPTDVFKISRNGVVYGIFVTDCGEMYDIRVRKFPK